MSDFRKNTRYQTLARAKIKGACEGETLLKDLSVTGCCVECTAYAGIEPKAQYKLEVIPESASKIDGFELLVESRWMRTENYSHEIGFVIIESPKGKQFQRYVDYLSWRNSQGNSMAGSQASGIPL